MQPELVEVLQSPVSIHPSVHADKGTPSWWNQVNGHNLPIGSKVVRQVILLDKLGKVPHPEGGAAHGHVTLSHRWKSLLLSVFLSVFVPRLLFLHSFLLLLTLLLPLSISLPVSTSQALVPASASLSPPLPISAPASALRSPPFPFLPSAIRPAARSPASSNISPA